MGWIKFEGNRKTSYTGILGDVESHAYDGHPYGGDDRANQVHELSHYISSKLRNEICNPDQNGFYFLNGMAYIAREPQTTLDNIARQIPPDFRDSTYNLYMVKQQQYWNDRPLYMFDEIAAYLNGTKYAYLEERDNRQRWSYSHQNGSKFIMYASYLLKDFHNDPELVELYRYCRLKYEEWAGRMGLDFGEYYGVADSNFKV